MGAHTLLPFPHVQGGIETVHQHLRHHTYPSMAFFFHLQHHASICRGHSIIFVPTFRPRVGKAEG